MERRRVAWGVVVSLVVLAALAPGGPAVQAAPPARLQLTLPALGQDLARLQAEILQAPRLAHQDRYQARLAALATSLRQVDAWQQQQAQQRLLLHTLAAQRAAAQAGVAQLQALVRADLATLRTTLAAATAPLSTTAQEVTVTNTVAITQARLELQLDTSHLALLVQSSAQVLPLLALATHADLDAQQLQGHLSVLAAQVHLTLGAVLHDLQVVQVSDPAAVADAQAGLAAGVAGGLMHLNDRLVGALEARQRTVQLRLARLQTQITDHLTAAALGLSRLQRAVLVARVAATPLTPAQRRQVATDLVPLTAALDEAATVRGQLADHLAELDGLQEAQARIDRSVQQAQADLDRLLAQSDAALQRQLRSDVTVTISETAQTVHVHLDTLTVDPLVRDLDFNVQLGLSVLQIAALHAAVVPETQVLSGSVPTRIDGVDLLLQTQVQGLQAHLRTDVAGVQAQQEQLNQAVRARVAALRTTLSQAVRPLLGQHQAAVQRLHIALAHALRVVAVGLQQVQGDLHEGPARERGVPAPHARPRERRGAARPPAHGVGLRPGGARPSVGVGAAPTVRAGLKVAQGRS